MGRKIRRHPGGCGVAAPRRFPGTLAAARLEYAPHALCHGIRGHCDRRRPCGHGSRAGGRAHGCTHAAADAQYRNARADELQSGDRRHRQGSFGEGNRCAGGRDGARGRRGRHPVPHPQCEQGTRGSRDARASRPATLQARHPSPARDPAELGIVPAGGGRHRRRGRACRRRHRAKRHGISRTCHRADGGHVPGRPDSRGPSEPPGRPRGRSAIDEPRGAAA